ncbi:DNA cytosine methyltransferase [Hoylesella buccalis]|nr:DNA cytosine methyltransferase [Hoylesella buccalis]UEA63008.1 DNA cytosine methyltransferase [Hoylesella buccalis]UWP49704.1 DNA cytosine methyltransferase [Hoylesella buccalis ATCC 35310]
MISTLIKPHLDSYNIVDLFAGCGGLSEGFIQNGFNLLAANEFDESVFESNKFNHYCPRKSFNNLLKRL